MSKDTGPVDHTIKLRELCEDQSSSSMMVPKRQAPVAEAQRQRSRKRRRTLVDSDSDDDNEGAVLQSPRLFEGARTHRGRIGWRHGTQIKRDEDDDAVIVVPGSYGGYNLQEYGFEETSNYMKTWFTVQDESQRVPHSQVDVEEEHDRAVEANKRDELDAVLEEDDLWWQEEAEEANDSDTSPPASQQMDDARTHLARHYEEKLKDTLLALIKAVVQEENKVSKTFWNDQDSGWSTWLEISCLVPILAATPLTILQQIKNGNLARAKRQDAGGNRQPAIYMRVLVNACGFYPTPAELTAVITHMRMYCQSKKTEDEIRTVASIDTKVNSRSLWGLTQAKQGQLKYLASKDSDDEPSRHHIENICDFAANLERRLKPLWHTPYWNLPLEVPLVEFGYAAAPVARLRQHREHQNSNYIMNLAEAICLKLFGLDYRMEQYVIFHIFKVEQAVAAEILFTRLGQGYTADGGGFSHALAGRSNDSAMNISPVEWRRFVKDAWDNSLTVRPCML